MMMLLTTVYTGFNTFIYNHIVNEAHQIAHRDAGRCPAKNYKINKKRRLSHIIL